ncbi:efflux RND transporter periplasmic adaptor subunit [Thiocystis violascens]|uniref:Membrane-fusion protein n=1 Tax=Thiocystis violascens (strain ATCC 17096 / DSM 198 / 6111) TaxID=765911 RepID=I3YH85_THIV6|nr:efflux RND transporter periplasmic adaptor subunit [Thiocystis violascens]AFL76353.1 membrane-fusion protein [Thiocystis violascens DSM 198]
MFVRLLLVLLALAAIVAGLAFLKYRQIQAEIALFSQPMPAPTVAAAVVETSTWEPALNAVGTVRAVQGVDLNNEVAGQVKQILFDSGAKVKQGQILLRLEDDVDRAELEGLQAAERLAQIQLDRNRALLKDRAVAQGDVDEIAAQLDQARAQVKSRQATIEKKAIRAPFAGQLGIRQVNLGQYLAEGSAIVPLQALDPVYVDYSLPERHLAQLRVGQPVSVRAAPYPDRIFAGTIQAISPGIDQGTRNVLIRARFENPDLALRPGMFARVATQLPVQERVLTLPREAVTFNTYGDSVFLIEETDGKTLAQRRQIRTGAVRGDEVAVLDGLTEGDRVIVAGQVKLTNGQDVSIVSDSDEAAAAPAQPE